MNSEFGEKRSKSNVIYFEIARVVINTNMDQFNQRFLRKLNPKDREFEQSKYSNLVKYIIVHKYIALSWKETVLQEKTLKDLKSKKANKVEIKSKDCNLCIGISNQFLNGTNASN